MNLNNIFKIKASLNEVKERLTACAQCPYFQTGTKTCGSPAWIKAAKEDNKIQYKGEEKQLCGCLMNVKAHLAWATCPIGIWNATKHDEIKLLVNGLNMSRFTEEDFDSIKEAHIRLFGVKSDNQKEKITNCKSCVTRMIDEINFLINNTNTNVERRIRQDS